MLLPVSVEERARVHQGDVDEADQISAQNECTDVGDDFIYFSLGVGDNADVERGLTMFV